MKEEKLINQFENYEAAIHAAYPDIMGDDGLAQPNFDARALK
ncbi:hypothetical protein [Lactococcus lactis]